jgi:hypothetical protein
MIFSGSIVERKTSFFNEWDAFVGYHVVINHNTGQGPFDLFGVSKIVRFFSLTASVVSFLDFLVDLVQIYNRETKT